MPLGLLQGKGVCQCSTGKNLYRVRSIYQRGKNGYLKATNKNTLRKRMGWSARNCSDSINKSRRVVQIMTKMIKAAVSMRVCRKERDWWYTGCFAEQLCYSSCNILLQALTGAQELMTRVTITLIDSTCSIKRCYSIPTEMKMIENTKNACFGIIQVRNTNMFTSHFLSEQIQKCQ